MPPDEDADAGLGRRLVGRVEDRTTALVTLAPPGGLGIEFVVDTGFTGDLAVPIERLVGWHPLDVGTRRIDLADGTSLACPVFACTVTWLGRAREVAVWDLGPGSSCLVGFGLLRGCRITLRDERVEIEPAPRPGDR